MANWIDDQYVLSTVDPSSVDAAWKADAVCKKNGSGCVTGVTVANTNVAFFNAAGLKTTDVTKVYIKIDSATGKSCVTLYSVDDGSYYITNKGGKQRYVAGRGCSAISTTVGHYVCTAEADVTTNTSKCTKN